MAEPDEAAELAAASGFGAGFEGEAALAAAGECRRPEVSATRG